VDVLAEILRREEHFVDKPADRFPIDAVGDSIRPEAGLAEFRCLGKDNGCAGYQDQAQYGLL
jgi:hypothetical protein